ncbi:MAG: cytochrome P450 [Ardenticatenaceae bacterium]|nr:cytochrome P450 [Ardenticatenaceae bacterium]
MPGDTSTAAAGLALHLLGKHPEAMVQAVAEVDAVVGQDDLTEAHMSQLPYLDSLIKETLRLYPPIHVGNRIAAQDIECSVNSKPAARHGFHLPVASDCRYWDAPEEFRPERFDRGGDRPPAFTYIPFGGGPRACIGAAFAQVEAKVVLIPHFAAVE